MPKHTSRPSFGGGEEQSSNQAEGTCGNLRWSSPMKWIFSLYLTTLEDTPTRGRKHVVTCDQVTGPKRTKSYSSKSSYSSTITTMIIIIISTLANGGDGGPCVRTSPPFPLFSLALISRTEHERLERTKNSNQPHFSKETADERMKSQRGTSNARAVKDKTSARAENGSPENRLGGKRTVQVAEGRTPELLACSFTSPAWERKE